VLLLGLIGGGVALKNAHDSRVAAAAAAAAAEKAATQSREQQQREAAAASAAKQRQDDAERASRKTAVTGIEASVKKLAEQHASTGVIRGPVISVTCSPVAGGSTDDLTQQTTVFSCFVANKDNGDGTMSGYNYHATMNWSTGSYTYGFGAP
jgi:membrane protein involved in colicin uptake